MKDKWLFIVNSTAGNGKTGKNINSLVVNLSKLGFDYQIELTKYQGHAIEIAASQAKYYQNIVAVGGDGTASEVVNGIIKSGCSKQVNFGIIPQGGGNDFCRLFHQTDNIENILIQYTKPVIKKIDVAAVEDFYFFNSLGIGFDAQVAAHANKITFLNGFPRYLLAVCLAMLKFKNLPLKIIIDEQETIEGNFLLLAIGNGKFAGGGFNLNPDALIDDGLLDIMLARDVAFLRIFTVLPMVLKGTHLSEREISYLRCRKLEVFSDVPVPIYCDGEIPLLKNPYHISINILHQAINFIFPTYH